MRLLGGEKYGPLLPPLRPWKNEFMGKMSKPSFSRLETNVTYYQSNYLILCMIILLISVMFTGVAFIVCPIIAHMIYFTSIRQSNELVIGAGTSRPIRITKNMVLIASSCISVVLIVLTGHWKNLAVSYAVSTLLILLHMVSRERQAARNKNQAFKSNPHRIFDPDEMLRRDAMERSSSFATTVTGAMYQPSQQQQQQYQPYQQQQQQNQYQQQQSYAPSMRSDFSMTTSGGGSVDSPTASKRATHAARSENRQQTTRQKMKEYGLD